jgi:hypothetical protein
MELALQQRVDSISRQYLDLGCVTDHGVSFTTAQRGESVRRLHHLLYVCFLPAVEIPTEFIFNPLPQRKGN